MNTKTAASLLALACAVPALAAADVTVVGAAVVHAAQVGATAVQVDARSTAEYAQGHIPGAVSLPAAEVKTGAARLPKDRATPLIFYCRGGG